jgi:Asp-tRNA(Asn)/Glu-tRNA(Gln) amidotransferase A subunit family amidase
VTGPLAATMADLEASYRIMAVPDPEDPVCSLFSPPRTSFTSKPKVLGVYTDWFNRAEPSVMKICNAVIEYYKNKLGYQIVEISLPYIVEGQLAHAMTILSEMAIRAKSTTSHSHNWLHGLNPANQVLLSVGSQTPAEDYLLAQQLRNMLMQHLAFLYKKYPGMIIVTATTPMAGWPIAAKGDLKHGVTDGNTSIRNMEYVWLANFCGNPAISCPVGYVEPVKGEGSIPVGLMGMGEWGTEDGLFDWGRECEDWLNKVYAGGRHRPANWEDVVVNAKGKLCP